MEYWERSFFTRRPRHNPYLDRWTASVPPTMQVPFGVPPLPNRRFYPLLYEPFLPYQGASRTPSYVHVVCNDVFHPLHWMCYQ